MAEELYFAEHKMVVEPVGDWWIVVVVRGRRVRTIKRDAERQTALEKAKTWIKQQKTT